MTPKTKDENLNKEQMKTIDKLQDKVKLLEFDKSKNLQEIRSLRDLVKRRDETIAKAREELATMKRLDNYKNINYVLMLLKDLSHEE